MVRHIIELIDLYEGRISTCNEDDVEGWRRWNCVDGRSIDSYGLALACFLDVLVLSNYVRYAHQALLKRNFPFFFSNIFSFFALPRGLVLLLRPYAVIRSNFTMLPKSTFGIFFVCLHVFLFFFFLGLIINYQLLQITKFSVNIQIVIYACICVFKWSYWK